MLITFIFARFDPKTGKWYEIAPMLQRRGYFALVIMYGKLIAIGGSGEDDDELNSVESYDLFERKWKYLASMNQKRYAHSVVVHGDRLYAFGGIDSGRINDSVEYYDLIINKWTLVGIKI